MQLVIVSGQQAIRWLFLGLMVLILQGCINASFSMIKANADKDPIATRHEISKLVNSKKLTETERNERLYSALSRASSWNKDISKELLEMGISPNYPNNNPDDKLAHSALYNSIRSEQYEISKLLIEYGANVNGPTRFTGYPLTDAVFWGREPFVKLLLDAGANPNVKGELLAQARLRGDKTIEKWLLDAGAVLAPTKEQMFAHLQTEYRLVNAKFMLALAIKNDDADKFAQLVAQYPQLNEPNEQGSSLAIQAVENNAQAILKWIYATDFNPKIVDTLAAFDTVIREDNAELLEYLLELLTPGQATWHLKSQAITYSFTSLKVLYKYQPAITYADEHYWLFKQAIRSDNPNITAFLLRQDLDINHRPELVHESLLTTAIKLNHEEQAQLLLDHGAKDFADTQFEQSAIYHAVKKGYEGLAVKLLKANQVLNQQQINWVYNYALVNKFNDIAREADNGKVTVENVSNDKGENLIHLAVRNQDLTQLAKFIDLGVDYTRSNKDGMTPLFLAAQNGFTDGVTKLLALGVDPFTKTKSGASLISVAASRNQKEVVDQLLPLYEQHKQHANELSGLLLRATKSSNTQMMRKLMAMGVSPDIKDISGNTLLYIAVEKKLSDNVVKALLAAGANPAVKNSYSSRTYPMIEAIAGWKKVSHVKLMIAAGADINIKNQYGNNGMDLLIQNGGMNWERLKTFRAMGGWPAQEASHFAKVDENGYIDDSNAWASMSISALNNLNAQLERETQRMKARFQANLRQARLLQKEQQAYEQAKLEASVRSDLAQKSMLLAKSAGKTSPTLTMTNIDTHQSALPPTTTSSKEVAIQKKSKKTDSTSNGLVLTWQTSNGNWKACGPVQCTAAQSHTEEESIDFVTGDEHHPTYKQERFGKCYIYSVENVKSYEKSSNEVKSDSDC